MVGDCGFWDGAEWIWQFQWRRDLFQWELELLNDLHLVLASVKLNRFSQDRLAWKFDKKGIFSVQSLVKSVMAEKEHANGINSFSFTKRFGKC